MVNECGTRQNFRCCQVFYSNDNQDDYPDENRYSE
jgi:hypothetical protein